MRGLLMVILVLLLSACSGEDGGSDVGSTQLNWDKGNWNEKNWN